jgi:hypothetical protein
VNWRNRRLRTALILAVAVFVAFTAWRTGQTDGKAKPCEAGRQEEKDASGKVVRITHTTCKE